jgi:putative flippase GtrA
VEAAEKRRAKGIRYQLVSFGVVGVASNVLAYIAFLALIGYLHVAPEMAMTIVYIGSATFAYFLNWRVTFSAVGSPGKTIPRFMAVHIAGYGLNLLLLHVFSTRLGAPAAVVQFAAIFVVAAYLFLAFKLFVFK